MANRRNFLKTAAAGVAAPLSGLAAATRLDEKGTLIKKVEVFPTSVPFGKTFVIGRGQVGAAGAGGRYVFVRLETADGHVGWGETNTVPNWSYETLESVVSTVRNYLAPIVIDRSPFDQTYFHRAFDDKLRPAVSHGFPFAKSVILSAAMDLCGQITGLPLHRLLGGKVQDKMELCYALSIDEPDQMAAFAKEFSYVNCFKLKVAGEPYKDAERVKKVALARPDADIWLDANQSYKPMLLETFLLLINGMPKVRCLEQPVASVDWLGMKRARDRTSMPMAADEGCFSSYDVARLARMEAADLIVLKVAKSGGLLNCQKSAAVAEANGLGLLGSGLTETGVGLIAAIHLYSTMDILLPPELNGPEFLSELVIENPPIKNAVVTVPDGPGLGVKVKEDFIRAHPIAIS